MQPNSNYELIDYQWVRMHSKFCTQLRLYSNCELIDYQWVRMHSKFCTQLRLHSNCELIKCSRTQIANSLIISEFGCTQSFALNCGCTQTANSLSAAELKLRTHWLSVSSYALNFRTQSFALNCSCTQLRLHSNFALTECNRTQITNSLIISEFVCTQRFALNCTQKMN